MGLLRAGDWGSGDSESKSQGYLSEHPRGNVGIQRSRCDHRGAQHPTGKMLAGLRAGDNSNETCAMYKQ